MIGVGRTGIKLGSSAAGRAAILVFKQFKQFGITAPLVVSQAAPTAPFYEAIGGPKVADGLLVPTQRGIFGAKAGGDTARLYADVQKALGRTPTFFMIFGFDAGLIMEAGVKIRTALGQASATRKSSSGHLSNSGMSNDHAAKMTKTACATAREQLTWGRY